MLMKQSKRFFSTRSLVVKWVEIGSLISLLSLSLAARASELPGRGLPSLTSSTSLKEKIRFCKDIFLTIPHSPLPPSHLTPESLKAVLLSTLNQAADISKFEESSKGNFPEGNFSEGNFATDTTSSSSSHGFSLHLPATPNSKQIQIFVDPSIHQPQIIVSSNEHRLMLPENMDSRILPSLLRKLFIGHPLHPYNSGALGPTTNYHSLKDVQSEAIQVLSDFLKQNQSSTAGTVNELATDVPSHSRNRKILFVGPGGVGKTAIYLQALEKQLSNKPGLFILVADTTEHLRQIYQATEGLIQNRLPTQLIKWGGEDKPFKAEVLASQVEQGAAKHISTILVTTIQSLRAQLVTDYDFAALRPWLRSLMYDEAHHAGASMAKNILVQLIDSKESSATLIGATATPIHRRSEISNLFGDNIHWFYLDESMDAKRPLSSIIDQLALAIDAGDITPFHGFHFLTHQNLKLPSPHNLFTTESEYQNNFRVLNPDHYRAVFGKLGPLLETQKKIVIMAGTIASANRILAYLKYHFPKITSESLHSQSKNPDVIFDDFKQGRYRVLVTVNKFDEALDDPQIDTVMDLSASSSPRQLMQRLARPARLAQGKEKITAVLFLEANEAYIREQIELVEAVMQRRLQSGIKYDSSDYSKASSHRSRSRKAYSQQDPTFWNDEDLLMASYDEVHDTLTSFWTQQQQQQNSIFTRQDRVDHLVNFIDKRMADKSKRLLPSLSAADDFERTLAQWLSGYKMKAPGHWYLVLPEYQQQKLREQGLLEKREVKSTKERFSDLIAFIDERMKQNSSELLPVYKTSNVTEENSFYYWFQSFKRSSPNTWYLILPKQQQEALREKGLIK